MSALETLFEEGEWSPFDTRTETEMIGVKRTKKPPSKATKNKENEYGEEAKGKEHEVAKKRKRNEAAKKKKDPVTLSGIFQWQCAEHNSTTWSVASISDPLLQEMELTEAKEDLNGLDPL
eukprot:Em0007g1049a